LAGEGPRRLRRVAPHHRVGEAVRSVRARPDGAARHADRAASARMKPARSVGRTLVLSAAGGAAVYLCIAWWAGAGEVASELGAFHWSAAAMALGLALVNYALRFCKWELYLSRLGISVPFGDSLQIFLAGFSLTMTPGKIGEVLKAYLLRETRGVPMA